MINMGDRIAFGLATDTGDTIYLYSHWGGNSWIHDLRKALMFADSYVNDTVYGNRIIISNIIGSDWSLNTGYGICVNEVPDCDYNFIPYVDLRNGTVTAYHYDWNVKILGGALMRMSIKDFFKASPEQIYAEIANNIKELEDEK